MRLLDFEVAQRVDHFIANSKETQGRIKKFYRRDSQVIYPPVDLVNDFSPQQDKGYFLYVGRLAKSKNVDLAIKACTILNLPLKLVGSGKGLEYLKSIAGGSIEFMGAVDDKKLHQLYAGAKAFIFPAEDEDFGIVPVEAMGHGVAVVSHRSGGPQETIIESKTGVFFDELTTQSLVEALKKVQEIKFDKKIIRKQAEKFSKKIFKNKIEKLVS